MRGAEVVCWAVIVAGTVVGVGTTVYVGVPWPGEIPMVAAVARRGRAPASRPAPQSPDLTPAPTAAVRPTPAEVAELRRLRRAEAEAFQARLTVVSEGARTAKEADLQSAYEEARKRAEDYRSQLRAKYGEGVP